MTVRSSMLRFALGAGVVGAMVLPATAAFAAPDPGCGAQASPSQTECTGGETVNRDVGGNTQVEGIQVAKAAEPAGELAFTGGDVAGLAAIGAAVVGAGAATVVVSRRRRSAES